MVQTGNQFSQRSWWRPCWKKNHQESLKVWAGFSQPKEGTGKEMMKKQDQREHGWLLGQGGQRFSIAGLYSINLEREYMKQKAKHRPRCKGCRLILWVRSCQRQHLMEHRANLYLFITLITILVPGTAFRVLLYMLGKLATVEFISN